jgi:predicted ATPase
MIKRLTVEGFKSFRKVSIELGHFNLFIGENASGKSNLLEVFRVIQGIGSELTIDEILNGRSRSTLKDSWDGIRGGARHVTFGGCAGTFALDFNISTDYGDCRYQIEIDPSNGLIVQEHAEFANGEVVTSEHSSRSFLSSFSVMQSRQFQESVACMTGMHSQQNLDLSLSLLRQYSANTMVFTIGERGEEFSALVRQIVNGPDKEDFEAWLREIAPNAQIEILSGALGEPLFALREDDRLTPAPSLSDGTLRFAAMAAAFFQPEMPSRITVEEIENGLHPKRLRTLVQLLKSQSERTGTQVLATTHSPLVLSWLEPEDYKHTFLCTKDDSGESHVTPLSEIPGFTEVIRDFSAAELFTEGWFETAL